MNPNELESLQWIQFALEDLKSAKLILVSSNDWVVPRYEAATIEDANLAYSHAKEIILLIVNEFQNRGLTLNSSILEIL